MKATGAGILFQPSVLVEQLQTIIYKGILNEKNSHALPYSGSSFMCLFIRGDFFFRYLAPIFGLAAGIFRFLTAMVSKALAPALFEKGKKED